MNTQETLAFCNANAWSGFACDMARTIKRYGKLTPRQQDAIERMAAKMAQNAKAKQEAAGDVDMSAIEAMFDHARKAGLNKRKYRADGLVIVPASASSRNAGALYITDDRTADYLGKVMAGKFSPSSKATPATLKTLTTIAADPSKAARDYGKRTGTCCACGRELTDPESIESGIGPICATKWGL